MFLATCAGTDRTLALPVKAGCGVLNLGSGGRLATIGGIENSSDKGIIIADFCHRSREFLVLYADFVITVAEKSHHICQQFYGTDRYARLQCAHTSASPSPV